MSDGQDNGNILQQRLVGAALVVCVGGGYTLAGATWLATVGRWDWPPPRAVVVAPWHLYHAWPDPAVGWVNAGTTEPPLVWWPAVWVLAVVLPVVEWLAWRQIRRVIKGFFSLGDSELGADRTERAGTEIDAHLADGDELPQLVVTRPGAGRFLLGRTVPRTTDTEGAARQRNTNRRRGASKAGTDAVLLAAPTPDNDTAVIPNWVAAARTANPLVAETRGGVILFGPPQSGKTTAVATGINTWDGPAIVLSVKRDLYDTTAPTRKGLGGIAVFDPSGLGLPHPGAWTPLLSGDLDGVADRLVETTAVGQPHWAAEGTSYLKAILWIASHQTTSPDVDPVAAMLAWINAGPPNQTTIDNLTEWLNNSGGGLADTDNNVEPDNSSHLLVDALRVATTADTGIPHRRRSREVADLLANAWRAEPRYYSSITGSAAAPLKTLLTEHQPPPTATPLTIDWLLDTASGPRTIYGIAAEADAHTYGTLLGAILGDLTAGLGRHAQHQPAGRLTTPVLVVVDEAANFPTPWLTRFASTCPGANIQLVTAFQDLSQTATIYGVHGSNTLVNNHRTRMLLSGTADPTTLNLFTSLAGSEQIAVRHGTATNTGYTGNEDVHATTTPLLPADVLRRLPRTQGILIHGDRPPTTIQTLQHDNLDNPAPPPQDRRDRRGMRRRR